MRTRASQPCPTPCSLSQPVVLRSKASSAVSLIQHHQPPVDGLEQLQGLTLGVLCIADRRGQSSWTVLSMAGLSSGNRFSGTTGSRESSKRPSVSFREVTHAHSKNAASKGLFSKELWTELAETD